MWKQILAKLKVLHPGLPETFLTSLAKQLEKKVTEESQIDAAITAMDEAYPIADQATLFQSETDRRVTEAKKKWEADNKPKPDPTKTDPVADPKIDENGPVAKKLAELEKKVLEGEKKERKQKARETLLGKLKEKDIPAEFAEGREVETDEEIEAAFTAIETSFGKVRQGFIDKGLLASEAPPVLGTSNKDGVSSGVQAYVEAKTKTDSGGDLGGKKV